MRLSHCFAVALAATLACDSARSVQQYSIADFYESDQYSGASFSPDNSKILVTSNLTGVYNAYVIPVEGGEPQALTESADDAVFAISYFPNDERFLYSQDRGGNELDHVFVRNPDASVHDLTPGEELKASFAGWADDEQSFFIETNERDSRFFDLTPSAAFRPTSGSWHW
jgi:Tol biopolymer transport system component